jgi:hypothetical protein
MRGSQSTVVLWIMAANRIFDEFQRPAIQTKIVQHFGGFSHQIKVRQPIGRKIL